MSDDYLPTLTHATERDIDLLLVEELYASHAFVAWTAARGGLHEPIANSRVLHSKRRTRSRREIDIFVEIGLRDGRSCALLIENKLDASEQPDQAESYREELTRIAEKYAATAMVLVCPRAYSDEHQSFARKFDTVVTYEALAAYFMQVASGAAEDLAGRARFRCEVIEQAIDKHRRGYTPVPNDVVGDFNAKYVSLLANIAPEIRPGKSMLRPANPDESTSMIFDAMTMANLPPEVRPTRFAHELGRGQDHRANYVAVTFGGWGLALPALKNVIEQELALLQATVSAKAPTKARPNPGLTIACPSPPVDNQKDFALQREQIIEGIKRAQQLMGWLLSNPSRLTAWREMAYIDNKFQ